MADYSYQDKLVDKVFNDLIEHKLALLAACPGAGKTRMSIKIIEKFKQFMPSARILAFAHGQLLLRQQWADVLGNVQKNCQWKIIETKESLKTKNDFLLAIPQTLMKADEIPEVDLLVIDEAHQICEGESTKKLIERIKPKYQLRLTGTPSIYINRPEWKISGITLQELLEYGVATDPDIILASGHGYKLSDYKANLNLSQKVDFKQDSTFKTLDGIMETLKTYDCPEFPKKMRKTMIVCHSQKQAKDVAEYYNKLGIKNKLSISDISDGIEEVEKFKSDPKCFVFIVVNRGTLGFDYDKLANLIDLSGTLNVNKLFQMLSRVIRRDTSNPNVKKLFLKVTTPEIAPLTHFVMSFVVSLSDARYYFTYHNKDTKSARVPVSDEFMEVVNRIHSGGLKLGGGRGDTSSSYGRSFPDLPKLYTFRDIKDISQGKIKTYALTDFKTVRRFITAKEKNIDIEQIAKLAKSCKSKGEFKKKYSALYKILETNKLVDLLHFVIPIQGKSQVNIRIR